MLCIVFSYVFFKFMFISIYCTFLSLNRLPHLALPETACHSGHQGSANWILFNSYLVCPSVELLSIELVFSLQSWSHLPLLPWPLLCHFLLDCPLSFWKLLHTSTVEAGHLLKVSVLQGCVYGPHHLLFCSLPVRDLVQSQGFQNA